MPDIDTPDWIKHAVVYQIFPDRFAKSDRLAKPPNLEPWDDPPTVYGYKGGDLLGVAERLDHLDELGVTAIYLNPIFQSAANHRYHPHDYTRIDPLLGGDAAFQALLEAAHERSMKVILDGVFNHASRGFFQFSDILENGDKSPYIDWFHIRQFPLNAYGDGGDLGYAAWWNLPALPKFNTDTEAVREFLWGIGTRWLERGVDGWRLDVPNEIDDDSFWKEFRLRCRAVNPECYIVGEIWDDAERWLRGDQFDAVMNYPFTRAVLGFVADAVDDREVAKSGYGEIPPLDGPAFAEALTELVERHPREVTEAQLNLLGSHDTPRALTVLRDDEAALRLAYLVQMTFPGAPCIYYGDEIGLAGGHDPACRQGMPWDRSCWNRELFEHVKGLIALRRAHRTLRTGAAAAVAAEGNAVVYARWDADAAFLIAVNAGDRQAAVPEAALAGGAPEGTYRDPNSGLELTLSGGSLRGHDLPARRGVVYRRID